MAKKIECPFCGQVGERSREHVWAQWLHNTPGAQDLMAQSHGERIPIDQTFVMRANDGRLQREVRRVGSYAMHLPHVTVSVCKECNSGWMSRLENEARRILSPFILGGERFVRLSHDDVQLLATWVVKSWMAYSLTRSRIENQFSERDYRNIAHESLPPERCRVWLLHSHEPRAHVGMGVTSTFLESVKDPDYVPADMATIPDNAGMAFVSVASCVFYMIRTPEKFPAELVEIFAPPLIARYGSRRIWPSGRSQYFPLDVMPDWALDELLEFPRMIGEALSMPTIGVTEAERMDAIQRFKNGELPRDLRTRYGSDNRSS